VPIPVLFAILILIGVGIWHYESRRQESQSTLAGPTSTSPAALANSCGKFEAFQSYVAKKIASPDQQGPMKMDPNVITSFEWKRAAGEPWITYPVVQGYFATYGSDAESKNAIRARAMANATAIDGTVTAEANSLGFVADNINTLPFQSFPDQDAYHAVYGFRDGSDLYSLVIRSDGGTQAPANGTVTVTCGRVVAGYDTFYNALHLKADATIENPYDNDVVTIQAVSPDNTVYGLSGYPEANDMGNYYYFNGGTPKLVSWGSYHPSPASTWRK